MQLMRSKVDTLNQKEGKKLLEKELKSSMDAEYVFSKVTDIGDHEIKIPAILLKQNLKNKEKYPGVTMHSKWSMINGDMGEREAWMFLNIEFEDLDTLKFKFNLFDANAREWIETLILANGNAVLCDRNKKTKFDIGLSNIPLDIPLAQMTLTALFMARTRSGRGWIEKENFQFFQITYCVQGLKFSQWTGLTRLIGLTG